MDGSGFDALTKSVAQPPSRRQLLRLLSGGGIAVLALRGDASAVAQGTPCSLTFTGTVRVGPSATQPITSGGQPGVLQGQLTFTPDQQGGISQGQLALAGGPTVPVVGHVNGRAINLRMAVNDKLVIVAVGTAAQALTTCKGSVDGLLTGPQLGDLGDWHATASSNGASQTPETGITTGATGGTTQTGAAGTSAAPTMTAVATQPTATTIATTTARPTATSGATISTSCPECQQPGNGGCVPVADDTPCSSGHCCGGICGDLSSNPNHCGSCINVCEGGSCADGSCQPCSSDQRLCNGICVDLNTDSTNCGACGTVCPAEFPTCIDGTCTAVHVIGGGCQAGQTACGGSCVDTSSDFNNCGACGNACPSGQICFGGNCATDHR